MSCSVCYSEIKCFSLRTAGRGLQVSGHRGGGTWSCKGEWPGRREGTSSAAGAVTDSSPVHQETLYTEPWGTQAFVNFGGKTECKLDFKVSVWLKLEALGLCAVIGDVANCKCVATPLDYCCDTQIIKVMV